MPTIIGQLVTHYRVMLLLCLVVVVVVCLSCVYVDDDDDDDDDDVDVSSHVIVVVVVFEVDFVTFYYIVRGDGDIYVKEENSAHMEVREN